MRTPDISVSTNAAVPQRSQQDPESEIRKEMSNSDFQAFTELFDELTIFDKTIRTFKKLLENKESIEAGLVENKETQERTFLDCSVWTALNRLRSLGIHDMNELIKLPTELIRSEEFPDGENWKQRCLRLAGVGVFFSEGRTT